MTIVWSIWGHKSKLYKKCLLMKQICTLNLKVNLGTFRLNWPLAWRRKPFNRNGLKSSSRSWKMLYKNAQHLLSSSQHHEALVVTLQLRSSCGVKSTPTWIKNSQIIKQGKIRYFKPKRQSLRNAKLKLLKSKCSSRKKIKKLIKFNKKLGTFKLKKTLKLGKCLAIKLHQSKLKPI